MPFLMNPGRHLVHDLGRWWQAAQGDLQGRHLPSVMVEGRVHPSWQLVQVRLLLQVVQLEWQGEQVPLV